MQWALCLPLHSRRVLRQDTGECVLDTRAGDEGGGEAPPVEFDTGMGQAPEVRLAGVVAASWLDRSTWHSQYS